MATISFHSTFCVCAPSLWAMLDIFHVVSHFLIFYYFSFVLFLSIIFYNFDGSVAFKIGPIMAMCNFSSFFCNKKKLFSKSTKHADQTDTEVHTHTHKWEECIVFRFIFPFHASKNQMQEFAVRAYVCVYWPHRFMWTRNVSAENLQHTHTHSHTNKRKSRFDWKCNLPPRTAITHDDKIQFLDPFSSALIASKWTNLLIKQLYPFVAQHK